jgi:hypothetical protein
VESEYSIAKSTSRIEYQKEKEFLLKYLNNVLK